MLKLGNKAWIGFLVVASGIGVHWIRSSQAVSSWINIIDIWKPVENQSAFRFFLPHPGGLAVTVVKYRGGNRNRTWKLSVEESPEGQLPNPERMLEFSDKPKFASVGKLLTTRDFVAANNRRFREPIPGMFYRRTDRSWQFLTYQDLHAANTGPTEVVPRNRIKPGQDCEFGEGYFIWSPGNKWAACDSDGNI
jgi:hypothetical protein